MRKLHMRQAYRIIPIYTADVSGVCSALYELGGMTVMHDPSGCNSTYNTHDEIRWYEQDSLIFISGLTDIDAIMGNDEKFLADIREAAEELQPKFIALASSPIPFMNGTDFLGLARALTAETGIPAFSVPTSGMHDYVYGAGLALAEIARLFVKVKNKDKVRPDKEEIQRLKVNLLGVTPLDFGPQLLVDDMKKRLEQSGFEVLSTWAMGDTLETLAKAGEADVNLVVSSVGIPAANVLREKFGTPFVVGTPLDGCMEEICAALWNAVKENRSRDQEEQIQQNQMGCQKVNLDQAKYGRTEALWQVTPEQVIYLNAQSDLQYRTGTEFSPELTIIGEPVTMGSLAAMIEKKYKKRVQFLCPLEITAGLLRPGDEAVQGEEAMEEKLKTAKHILADPLYRPICPESAEFHELPHIAFSGRMYLKEIKKYGKRIY